MTLPAYHDPGPDMPTACDVKRRLEAFVRGDRREESFTALVRHYGGMVHASALRRTGSADLAEEITQTVFTILARKAPSLLRHPSLTGWVFQTTRLEARKAMRTESRRKKKHQLYADEWTSGNMGGDEARWQEALPLLDKAVDQLPERDRWVILGRFFERKKFRDLAQESGCSEAASKMQVRRALDKLSSLLGARGARLSTTSLTAGLSIHVLGSGSAKAATTLTVDALSTASSVSTGTIFTNTLLTMTATKQTFAIGAIIVALCSVPVVQQAAHGARLQKELAGLEAQHRELQAESPRRNASRSTRPRSLTVSQLIGEQTGEVTAGQFLEDLRDMMTNRNMISSLRLTLPLLKLDADSGERLLDEIAEYPGYEQIKPFAMQLVGNTVGQSNPQRMMERLIEAGVPAYTYSSLLRTWGEKDPEAALAWFRARQSDGGLDATGVHQRPAAAVFGHLIKGLAMRNPDRALQLYLSETDLEVRKGAHRTLAALFPLDGDASEGRLRQILEQQTDPEERFQIVNMSLWQTGHSGGDYERALDLLDTYVEDPDKRASALVQLVQHPGEKEFGERADWLMENIAPEQRKQAIEEFISTSRYLTHGDQLNAIGQWTDRQPAGELKDVILRKYSQALVSRKQMQKAYDRAEQITDPEARDLAIIYAARSWLRLDREAAEEAIAPEIMQRIGDGVPVQRYEQRDREFIGVEAPVEK